MNDYQRAIEQARRGEYQPALEILERLRSAQPNDPRFIDDEIVVRSWAGEDDKALALMGRIDAAAAPYYVLEAAAGSARRLRRWTDAQDILHEAVRRFPQQMQGRLLLAETLSDLQRPDEGWSVLEDAPPSTDRSLAQAAFADYRSEPLSALRFYGDALAAQPDHPTAIAGQIRAAARLGAAHLAYELAAAHPNAVPPAEVDELNAERTALDIRWAIAREKLNAEADRFGDLDKALHASDAAAGRLAAGAADLTAGERHLLLDRVVALTERFRMAEAVQLYRTLDRERPGKLPPYVKAAAGHALLYLHEPRQAAALFQAAIAEGDDSFSTRMGLFYALEDAGDHDRAIDHIDRLAADQRKRIGAEDDTAERENTSYVSARTAAALARSWANDQEEAQRRLAALAEAAPHNGEVRSAAAGVMRSRGWPRRASDAYAEIVANDPDDAGARAEHAQALLDFDSFRAAEAEVRAARAQRPEDSGVRRAGRLWDIHQGAELDVDAGMGRSSGNAPTGTRDAHIESYLYSPPIDYNWRPFIHAYWAEGRFTDATARIERWAGGLEYRNAGLVLSGEASTGCCGSGRIGAAAAAQWWTDDHWHINGAAELQSNQVPLQARLAGYSADRAAAGTGYRFNERHAFDINAGVLHISDGNVRRSVYATWDERLYASARLKLDLRAGVYASANTRGDAPYFNPRSDFSPAATLSLEWLTWHSYDRSFSQKLSGTLGTYDQAGFGAIRTSELLYEHIWDIDNFLSVRYGAGRVVHPYDGRQSGRNYLNLALVARFW